jgi:hypothetical protein
MIERKRAAGLVEGTGSSNLPLPYLPPLPGPPLAVGQGAAEGKVGLPLPVPSARPTARSRSIMAGDGHGTVWRPLGHRHLSTIQQAHTPAAVPQRPAAGSRIASAAARPLGPPIQGRAAVLRAGAVECPVRAQFMVAQPLRPGCAGPPLIWGLSRVADPNYQGQFPGVNWPLVVCSARAALPPLDKPQILCPAHSERDRNTRRAAPEEPHTHPPVRRRT